MKLQRAAVLPSLFLALGSAIACGDDDTPGNSNGGVVVLPGSDSGVIPATPNDAGSDASDGGGTKNEAGPGDAGTDAEAGTIGAPHITTTLLPGVVGGVAASLPLFATGAGPFTWTLVSGALPPGLTLSSDGTIAGTPTTVGEFTFTIKATNALGSDSATVTLTVLAPSIDAYALTTDNKLAAFSTLLPSAAAAPKALNGITAGTTLVSLDFRPQNGWLYALGFDSAAKSVQLYALDPESGLAKPIGVASTANPAIAGTTFGMDVNPQVDRIRVVTSAGQNFRMSPTSGAFVDSDGNAGNGNTPDGAINGGASAAAAETAYTNNHTSTTITTQYTIAANNLYVQNPPNSGTLTLSKTMSNVESVFGFDIPDGVDATAANAAVLSGKGFFLGKLTGSAAAQLASVDLTNGNTVAIGALPFTGAAGFTLAPNHLRAIVALGSDGTQLLRFNEDAPGATASVTINGVTVGESLVSIDYRPATGQLYGLGINDALNVGTLYLLDPQSGAATPVGLASQVQLTTDGVVPVDFPDAGGGWGMDFNSALDRVRVTTAGGLNFRINPDSGAPIDGNNGVAGAPPAGTNPDKALSATGVREVAYTNGPPAAGGAGITTEYAISLTDKALYIVKTPNEGALQTAITLKTAPAGAPLDVTAIGGFDIPLDVKAPSSDTAVTDGSGYGVFTVGGVTSLYIVNLADGASGKLGDLAALPRGIAVGR